MTVVFQRPTNWQTLVLNIAEGPTELRAPGPRDPTIRHCVEYADDTDFISTSRPFLNDIERIAPPCLAEWSLTINGSKTERTSISRHVDRIEEEWRMTRKLGSLLGEAEDVARRKQLANVAFRKLSTVWFRRAHISLQLRLLYDCTRRSLSLC